MEKIKTFDTFTIYKLNEELVKKYGNEICAALDQIPQVESHKIENLLAKQKGDRVLYSKWQHSLIALDNDKHFAGVIIGYERKKEDNNQYPENTIYLNDFAVAAAYQQRGLGKFLLQTWLEVNKNIGLLDLEGNTRFAVQTNSAEWNKHVQNLYKSFGFKQIATKEYDNRTDVVYCMEV